ncbi:PREDICTED: uncharacterized protein LOC105448664 [Wasmannia auropunctata]|uniref:uncharacterized protein LOC105448664 n=1 Tax=Wasmannia auropunctata TaxID=64793 RepID=UPI0005F007CC|nr:PREDICTED: uncharacterized protein LOC105448664 [Wasmannia auropunctata]
MRITCLITVCAYLSTSIVSTEEIQYLNRLKRTRSREESILGDATASKVELNPIPEIRPDVFSTLRKSQSQGQIETFQKPYQKKVHESQSKPQQQHPRSGGGPISDRSRRPVKRLRVRSIAGSTYEVNENEVHELIQEAIPEVHDEGPIYIKPVYRVHTKKNVFDSIVDILHQLLDPPKKELGPIVGPIHMPGSKRKIYLRLMEPVDESHINVRFVTQVPVPVVNEEIIAGREHDSSLPYLPYVDPSVTLLNKLPGSSDTKFSSSNRHQSIQLPGNVSHVKVGKSRGPQPKPATKLKRPPENPREINKENVLPVKVVPASEAESDKNHLYYQYQTEDDAVRHVTEIINEATENEQGSKDILQPWYQLSTHRLPLRQIAPLYPLSAMEPTDSSSNENTYKVPSDSLTVPGSLQSSTYEQYAGNANAANLGFYDQPYTIPNAYPTTHQKQNEFSNAPPSSYPISYQNQNKFNNAPSSTSYVKQNDLFSAPTIYTSPHEKPAAPPPSSSYATSHGAQNGAKALQIGSSSQNALHIIDPPTYPLDPRQVPKNHHANKVFEYTTGQQQPNINLPDVNEIGSSTRNTPQRGVLPIEQVTWGKVKREKSELNLQKNADNAHETWQPLMLVSEDVDWQKAFANLAKVANLNQHEAVTKQQQSFNRQRQVSRSTTPSTIEMGRVDQRQSSKHRNPPLAAAQNTGCLSLDKRGKCVQTESIVSTSRPEDAVKFVREQPQSAAYIEPVMITPRSASNTVEISRPNVTVMSWIEEPQPLVMTTERTFATNSTTEKSLLIKKIKNTPEKLIEDKTTLIESMMSNFTLEKSMAGSTTERSSISGTSEASIRQKNTTKRLQLPKRPLIMKKPTFVLKGTEPNSTTKRTVTTTWKPMSSTTEIKRTAGRSKYWGSAGSKTKSSSI